MRRSIVFSLVLDKHGGLPFDHAKSFLTFKAISWSLMMIIVTSQKKFGCVLLFFINIKEFIHQKAVFWKICL